jgi:N-acetylglucosamine kinase-like BadF-type ATPase
VRYCAGIDGGQSTTVCAIGDERGVVVARASGPPADLVGESRDSLRQAAVLDDVLSAALAHANLPAETTFAAIVAGLSGYDEGESPVPAPAAPSERFRVVHDTEIAHAGAFDGSAGIVLVAGTGSVALGIDVDGNRARAGGWGHLFGDEGSAFWIAREAIGAAMRDEDSGTPPGLRAGALEYFGVESLRALQHAVAHGEISRSTLAGFAAVVLQAAREGERSALELRRRAVDDLARLVYLVHHRLGAARKLPIAPLGGMFSDGAFHEHWKWAMRALERSATIVKPKYDPVVGALRLAYRDAALDVESLVETPA